jgi:class 3 adenylate cyclase
VVQPDAVALARRLVAGLERSALARRLEALDAFSPLARLRIDGPGSRALLRGVERAAERALHVARGLFFAILLVMFVLQTGKSPALVVFTALAFPLIALLWIVVWRMLRRPAPPRALPYVLILADTWLALRGPIAVRTPLWAAIGAAGYLTPSELGAMSGAWLTVVAITGAFRLNPRLAVFSTIVALLAHTVIVAVLGMSWNVALAIGAMILFAGALGVQVARVFRYTMLKAREEAVLERYVPEALVEELARTGDPLGAGRETDISVLIVDIRGYTQRVERLTPRDAVAFLNDYFSVVVAPLADEGAVLDKYIGDGVFAFLEGTEHQRRALRAARAILEEVDRHNAKRPPFGPVTIGIALHTGRALVGTIGAEQKREYTAIADAVNVAARLEELNKTYRSSIVASEAVMEAVLPEERTGFVGPAVVQLRGRDAAIAVRYLPIARPDR